MQTSATEREVAGLKTALQISIVRLGLASFKLIMGLSSDVIQKFKAGGNCLDTKEERARCRARF